MENLKKKHLKKLDKRICLIVCLGSKMYSFNCGDDIKNKLKGFSKSQSKHNKFEECRKCLHGEEYERESNIFLLRSINHEMYFREKKNQHYLYSILNDVI